ncbi:unnamed protein product [Closterium sp. Yama58-4]|nr:unnamed protein product [Closterium sp. Yama58-4]
MSCFQTMTRQRRCSQRTRRTRRSRSGAPLKSAAAAAAAAAAGRGLKRKDLEKGATGGGASGAAAAGTKKGKVELGKRTPPLPAKREPGAGGAAAGKPGGGASGAAAAGPKPTAVTEEAVKGILRQAPIKSADLVNRFRACLKTAEDKKRFQEIIKRVGKIQAVNGEKFINTYCCPSTSMSDSEDKERFQEIIKRVGKIQLVNGEKFLVLR